MSRTGMVVVLLAGWVAFGAGTAGAQEEFGQPLRDPTPEGVSFLVGVGFLEPFDRFGDHADGGLLVSIGGLYHLSRWIAPEFAAQYGFLDGPTEAGDDTTIDTYRLLGGFRTYFLPESFHARPWGGVLAGWGHYESSPRRNDLRPVLAEGRDARDDFLLSIGGGLDVRLHPNLTLGAQLRYDHSFTDDSDLGERDLQSMTALGTVAFNY